MELKKGDKIKMTQHTDATDFGEFIEFSYEGNCKKICFVDLYEGYYAETYVNNLKSIERMK